MKQGGTLTEVLSQVRAIEANKKDLIAPRRLMSVRAEPVGGEQRERGAPPQFRARLVLPDLPLFNLRKRAHAQLAGELGIPQAFYDRLLETQPELYEDTVNKLLLEAPEERRMVRTVGTDVRALLSSRYRPLDNYDLAEAVLPQLSEAGMEIVSAGITEDRFYLKAVSHKIQGEVKVGDVVEAGVVIGNSEVGAGSLYIDPFLHRLICLNGAIINEAKIRKYHVGKRAAEQEGAVEFFSDETRRADDKAFFLRVRDTVRAAFDQGFFNKHLNLMRAATGQHIEIAPTAVVEQLHDYLREEERGRVLEAYIQGGDNSVYGVANAVTLASQAVEDYDRATELERLGGDLLAGAVKVLN